MAVKIYIPSFLYGATGAQNIYDSTFSGEHTLIDRGIKYINIKSDFYPTFIRRRKHLGDRFGKMMIPNPNFFLYIYIYVS